VTGLPSRHRRQPRTARQPPSTAWAGPGRGDPDRLSPAPSRRSVAGGPASRAAGPPRPLGRGGLLLGLALGATGTAALLLAVPAPLCAPLGSGPRLGQWLATVGPTVAALAGLRLVALGAGGVLGAASSLALVASLPHHLAVARLAGRLTPHCLQVGLAVAVAGASLPVAVPPPRGGASALPAPAASTSARPPPEAPPSLLRLSPPPERPDVPAGPPSLGRVGGLGAEPAGRPGTTGRPREETTGTAPSGGAGGATWTVAPGDSFWSIAAAVVEGEGGPPGGPQPGRARRRPALGTPSTEEAVARYWVALVAANRSRLPVPGDPDLLFTGDRIVLPPLLGADGSTGPEQRR